MRKYSLLLFFLFWGLQVNCQSADDYYKRGENKLNIGDLNGAILDFTMAIQLRPRLEPYFYRAICKIRLNKFNEAMMDLNEVIKYDLYNGDAYFFRGFIKMEFGDNRGALQDFDKSLKFKPNGDAYFYRGSIKESLNDLTGAVLDYTDSIKLNPENSDSYLNRGSIVIISDKDKGCLDLSKAGELGNLMAYELIKEFCN